MPTNSKFTAMKMNIKRGIQCNIATATGSFPVLQYCRSTHTVPKLHGTGSHCMVCKYAAFAYRSAQYIPSHLGLEELTS